MTGTGWGPGGTWMRPLGRTGLTVSAVCLGGSPLGGLPHLDQCLRRFGVFGLYHESDRARVDRQRPNHIARRWSSGHDQSNDQLPGR